MLAVKAGTPAEPFDMAFGGFGLDYADAASAFVGLLNPDLRATGNGNYSYFKDARVSARIAAASRLRGEARAEGEARRKAWADLEVDLMRTTLPGRRS